ncbi:MAG: hypothetical protein KJ069_16125 [Anaerolineae bacterium]|nr:hypothetical protein [Anaerolineae bacterium]
MGWIEKIPERVTKIIAFITAIIVFLTLLEANLSLALTAILSIGALSVLFFCLHIVFKKKESPEEGRQMYSFSNKYRLIALFGAVLVPVVAAIILVKSISSSPFALLFDTDFSSGCSEWDNYIDEQGNAVGCKNGQYFLNLVDNSTYFMALWGEAGNEVAGIENIILQVEVVGPFDNDEAQVQGIGFGWNKWKGVTFAFDIVPEGRCRFVNNAKGTWHSFASSPIPGFVLTESHVLTVVIENDQARGFVNGKLCTVAKLEDYVPGYVGVVGKSAENGGELYFDNYKIFIYRWDHFPSYNWNPLNNYKWEHLHN